METNSGLWLGQTLRASAVGTWWSAETAGGQSLGLLQLDPSLVTEPTARDRVAAAVTAVRSVHSRGVLRTTELVMEAKRAWLVVASTPAPTLSELLAAAPALRPGALAGVAVDVAEALRDLHAMGLSHGDLGADSIVLTPGGGGALVEVGVLTAMQGMASDVGRDTLAWAALARTLAGVSAPDEAEVLTAAAVAADGGDLAYAVRRLAYSARELSDFEPRESLVDALPAIRSAPSRNPGPRSTLDAGGGVRFRFGPGVPPETQATNVAATTSRPLRRWRPAIWVATVILAGLGAGAALWWWLS